MVSKKTLGGCLLTLSLVAASGQSPAATTEAQGEAVSSSSSPSKAQTIALGYLRTLWVAQREYQKKNGQYATSLNALVGRGSFTRRMAQPNRGDYTVRFRSNGKEYSAELVPKTFDSEHRAYYIDESGVVRSEEDKVATASSPEVQKANR